MTPTQCFRRYTTALTFAVLGVHAFAQGRVNGPDVPPSVPASTANPATVPPEAHGISHYLGMIGGTTGLVVVLLLVAVIVGLLLFFRRGTQPWEDTYSEPEQPHSRYEQLLAEIQGLRLRLAGGETPGYYRKVEVLARLFLERSGFPGARLMNETDIKGLLSGTHIPPQQAQVIGAILDRSRQGAEHENEKMDFSADDLLRELYGLIRQAEGGNPKHA